MHDGFTAKATRGVAVTKCQASDRQMRPEKREQKKGSTMCFRPSALAGNEPQVQLGTCPHCGMPVAASIGINSGECPHCHKTIDSKGGVGSINSASNVKIL